MSTPCPHPGCKGRPSKATGLCPFHDPAKQAALAEGRSEGGKKSRQQAPGGRALGPETADVTLQTKEDFLVLMALTINQVRKGTMGTETGRTVGYLAGVALKALDEGDTNERVKALEEKLRILSAVPTDTLLAAAKAHVNGAAQAGH